MSDIKTLEDVIFSMDSNGLHPTVIELSKDSYESVCKSVPLNADEYKCFYSAGVKIQVENDGI